MTENNQPVSTPSKGEARDRMKVARQELDTLVRQISSVTWVGLWINLFICASKIITGILGNSRAVVADGIHSMSDMVTDIVILVGVRYWVAPADGDHPYGHQRLESLITLFIGVSLGVAGIGIAWDAISNIGTPPAEHVGSLLALATLVISIISKEWLFHWTLKKGRELKSAALEANAWEHRSDVIASLPIVVAVSIAIWFPRFAVFDLLGAILVAGFILHAAWKICLPAFNTLIDKGADRALRQRIIEYTMGVEGVLDVHALRTRYMGQALVVDMHAGIKATLTVKEGNVIAHRVEDALRSPEAEAHLGVAICNALVHIDPVEDESFASEEPAS